MVYIAEVNQGKEKKEIDLIKQCRLDCPGFSPGPLGPGSGPDPKGRSECLGQVTAGLALRVRPGPDQDRH